MHMHHDLTKTMPVDNSECPRQVVLHRRQKMLAGLDAQAKQAGMPLSGLVESSQRCCNIWKQLQPFAQQP